MHTEHPSKYTSNGHWLGRSLENYKSALMGVAEAKGLLEQFRATKTLTQARKVLWGYKKKNTR